MTEQDKARETARLLLAWADGKTLQRAEKPGEWIDWDGLKCPRIINLSWWRVKPEPRRLWMSRAESSLCSHSFDEAEAESWKQSGMPVTEWQEVLK